MFPHRIFTPDQQAMDLARRDAAASTAARRADIERRRRAHAARRLGDGDSSAWATAPTQGAPPANVQVPEAEPREAEPDALRPDPAITLRSLLA